VSDLRGGLTDQLRVDGRILRRDGAVMFLQDAGAEGVVIASGPKAFVERVFATVKPTGTRCSRSASGLKYGRGLN
jgi:hypothetical protein